MRAGWRLAAVPYLISGYVVLSYSGVVRWGGCAMREWWRSSDIVFKVSVAIIVVELVLLFIGLDFAPGWG
jgi:hypothetical protein